jgi:hypothetical protein
VTGHRLWCAANSEPERFLPIAKIELFDEPANRLVWTEIEVNKDDTYLLASDAEIILEQADIAGVFHVIGDSSGDGRTVRLQQITPLKYKNKDDQYIKLNELAANVRKYLWVVATTDPASYRFYFLYLSPKAEREQTLPQLLGIYTIVYFLGSITRYRPHLFREIIESSSGELIQEILTTQPSQFLYLLASEFARRDVVRAPLV